MNASRITMLVIVAVTLVACGREPSRVMGKEHRQVLDVPHMKQIIGAVSMYRDDDSTIKDVTFLANDGYVYTQEFKDVSPLEGIIRWVPHGQSESIIQSRALSRWTGSEVNLSLPEDCKQVLGVVVSIAGEGERVKNLTYLSNDGNIYAKEYREGVIDRNFEGWLEVRAAQK